MDRKKIVETLYIVRNVLSCGATSFKGTSVQLQCAIALVFRMELYNFCLRRSILRAILHKRVLGITRCCCVIPNLYMIIIYNMIIT